MAISCLKRGSEKLWRLVLACLRSRFSLCPLWVSIFYLTRHRKNVLHPPVTCRRWLQSEKWKKPFFHTGNPRIGLRFESAAKTASKALQPSDSGRSDAHTMPLEMLCRRQKLPQRCDVERLCTKQRERQSHRRRPANSIGQGMQGAFFYENSPVSIPPSLSIRMQFAKNFSTRSKSELLSLFRKTKPNLNSPAPKWLSLLLALNNYLAYKSTRLRFKSWLKKLFRFSVDKTCCFVVDLKLISFE